MDYDNYPGFFKSIDNASTAYQNRYLLLIRSEYLLLILASVVSLRIFDGPTAYLIFAGMLLLAMAALLTRLLSKPEQNWYKCRALAESVKTMSWRYVMRSEPFYEDGASNDARNRFRDHLQELFTHNRQAIEKMDADQSADDQITAEMDHKRSLDLPGRIGYYSAMRVGEQRNWYANKARWNQIQTKRWSIAVVLTYVLAAGLSLARIRYSDWDHWPIDPLVVIASSMIGWIQIKKFSELSAAYKVTALEIGLILPKLSDVKNDNDFSEFVSEAESAFSREHTMWIARQTS